MNNAIRFAGKFLVVLNDNRMSICPRVGGVADYLDRLRTTPFYSGLKTEVVKALTVLMPIQVTERDDKAVVQASFKPVAAN